jgi:hypothetical protein
LLGDEQRLRRADGRRHRGFPKKIVARWNEARQQPFVAARALQAFQHVNPFDVDEDGQPRASDEQLELAQVGALLRAEEISNSRGLVEKPMQIQFVPGSGPRVVPYKLEEADAQRPEGPVDRS